MAKTPERGVLVPPQKAQPEAPEAPEVAAPNMAQLQEELTQIANFSEAVGRAGEIEALRRTVQEAIDSKDYHTAEVSLNKIRSAERAYVDSLPGSPERGDNIQCVKGGRRDTALFKAARDVLIEQAARAFTIEQVQEKTDAVRNQYGVTWPEEEARSRMGFDQVLGNDSKQRNQAHRRLDQIVEGTIDTVYVLDRLITAGDKKAVRLWYKNNQSTLEDGRKAWARFAEELPNKDDCSRMHSKDVLWIIEEARKIAEENPQ